MNTRTLKIATSAAATLATAAALTMPAAADTSSLCAKGDPSNCYIIGNFPPEIAQGFGITDERSMALRFVDGEWSMDGKVIGSFSGPGWTPIVGDWDGDGYDNIGAQRGSVWALKNSWNFVNPGNDSIMFFFGTPNAVPVTGDWNDNGSDSIGTYLDGTFTLLMEVDYASPQRVISFGDLPYDPVDSLGARPVVGSIDGAGDLVGIVEGHSVKYASTVISATYDFHNPGGGMLSLNEAVIQNRHAGLYPVVVDAHDPNKPNATGPRLLFSRIPANANKTHCPIPTAFDADCIWLVTTGFQGNPSEGSRTDVPDPEIW